MANVKISELSPLVTVQDADVLPIVDNAITKKVTAAILRSYTQGNSVLLTGAQTIAGIKTFTAQLASSVATGTAPFSVASTTKVTNLNADLLDGLSSAAFQGALTLTTTGSSGASTLNTNTLNVPNYTLAGLGGVPYTGATQDVNLGLFDLYTAKVWLKDVPNDTYGSMELTDGVLHFEDGDGHSMFSMEDGYFAVNNTPSIRALFNVSALTVNRDFALPNATGTLALTSDLNAYVPTTRTVSTTSPLVGGGALSSNLTLSIGQSTASTNGYLNSTDWTTFNNKQAAGNYITALTGEASASGPGSASITLTNSAVIGKVLTGLNVAGGSVSATDSILDAFGKVQNQINSLVGGTIYKGTWNASTNTPTLTSSVGTQGFYYIVSVAGATNLNGITSWNVGDWAIFDGTAWQKVDNTDSVVSVNGLVGAVSLTTSNITEGTNLYFTDARSRAAISGGTGISYNSTSGVITNTITQYTDALSRASLSFSAGSGAYNSTTGVITIPTNNNQITNGAGYITSSALSSYLPLAGGTLTGGLNGTSASFSSSVTAGDILQTSYGTARIQVTSTTNSANSALRFGAKNASGTTKNAGLYYVSGATSADTFMSFAADDTNYQFNFLANGFAGFGTTTPDSQLVLNGTSFSRFNMRAGDVRYGTIYADSGVLALASITAIPLVLGTNDVARLTIAATGAATFSSSVATNGNLSVNGNVANGTQIKLFTSSVSPTNANGFVLGLYGNTILSSNIVFDGGYKYDQAGTGAMIRIAAGSSNAGEIIFTRFASGSAGASATEINIMTLKSTGVINIANIPTSPAGLSTGDIWSNLGILTIV